jgi:phytoene dehydrogenase-like protein
LIFTRRQFVGNASAALIGLSIKGDRRIEGGFVNESAARGHALRDGAAMPAPKRHERFPIVIVGGGIAGLSAAWHLERSGFRDFVLLEMETQPGGNARWGENQICAFPWAAHYVPIPNRESTLVRELFLELGVMDSYGNFDERYLCATPQERLFIHGRWQDGIEPTLGASARDQEEFKRFHAMMQEFRAKRWFTIPLELGVALNSPEALSLDKITMADWLRQQGFTSPYLLWYIDYACRDDYGASSGAVSAWAGIHYFASRQHDEIGPLTWPEGNGWIARRLIAKLDSFIRRGSMAHRISKVGNRYRVFAGDVEYSATAVIFAAPTFLAPYVIEGFPKAAARGIEYSPWLTANLTIERPPAERNPQPAWDNVIYGSPSLGYVIANHQQIRRYPGPEIWTYYHALTHADPRQARTELLQSEPEQWKERILSDLQRAHPDIRQCVTRIDMMRMGHAMVRPVPNYIWSKQRRTLAAWPGHIFFAHSDLSGVSIFEEAQSRGVEAARSALKLVS